MEKRMNIYLDNGSRKFLEHESKMTGKSMSSIIVDALINSKNNNKLNLFQVHHNLYNEVSNLIQSIEIERDYTDRELSETEETIYQMLNSIWDTLRNVPCFRETDEERISLISSLSPDEWLMNNPYNKPNYF